MVHLQHVWETYKDKGVVVLGFNTADTKEKIIELMAQKGVDYPCVYDPSDQVRQIATDRYGASAVPMTYIIDPEGKIALAFAGYSKGDERGLKAVEALLAGKKVERVREPKAVFGRALGADGAPLAGALVMLMNPGSRGTYKGTTDGDGNYEIKDVPPGEYTVRVQVVGTPGFACPGGHLVVEADRALEHDVRLAGGAIEGRIVLKEGGKPLHPLDVSVWASLGSYFATPDEEGRFRLVGLMPGAYEVRVTSSLANVRGATREVEVKDEERGVDFELETKETGKLRLTIVDAKGKPVLNAAAFQIDDTGVQPLFGKYIEDGVYEFDLEVGERVIMIDGGSGIVRTKVRRDKTTEEKVTLGR